MKFIAPNHSSSSSQADLELVSALLDNEQENPQAVFSKALSQEQEEAWGMYHLIGDIMRDPSSARGSGTTVFSARVAQALSEGAIYQSATITTQTAIQETTSQNIDTPQAMPPIKLHWTRRYKEWIGGAVAMAAVAVVGLTVYSFNGEPTSSTEVVAQQTAQPLTQSERLGLTQRIGSQATFSNYPSSAPESDVSESLSPERVNFVLNNQDDDSSYHDYIQAHTNLSGRYPARVPEALTVNYQE